MRIALQNFTGGEIAPTLSARYDLARFKNSVQCMENFLPNLHGDVSRRMGTQFVQTLDGESVLIPFSFNADAAQNFVLLLSQKALRVVDIGGNYALADPLHTPYAAEHLLELSYAQVGDVVYLAHRNYPFSKVVRRKAVAGPGYAWALETVHLNSSLAAPEVPTVKFSPGDKEQWDKNPGTYTLRYKIVAIDKNGKESLASPSGETAAGKHPSDWLVNDSCSISWSVVTGAEEYNIYREEAGYYGFIGISKELTFIDNNYQADVADTPREDWDPFADGNNPGVVAFHQQRMVLAATPKAPQAFYMSRVGDFENFRKSRPMQDDDPVEYLIASGSIDAITWISSFGDLMLGTSGSEYKASGDGASISAKNISITSQSYWGSAGIMPLIIGNSIVHVQRHGSRVRDLFYSLEKDGYAGNDLSIMAPHLFDGHTLRQWCYQQSPGSVVWAVRDDGVLLALTYMKEHDIWGWSRHMTQGEFRSVAVLSGDNEDVLFSVVRRVVNGADRYFLERLAPRWQDFDGIEKAFFVDCGLSYQGEARETIHGLGHLEGCPVAVLADGSPVEGCVVKGGSISLPYPARMVHVGLAYTSAMAPMPIEADMQQGSTLGKQRAYGQCGLRLAASVGGKYGPSRMQLYDIPCVPQTWGEAVPPYSGDVDIIPSGGMGTASTLWLVQDRPMPFNVVAIVVDVDMAQQ